VILAAGRGTRMKNLTDETPKPMLKIKDKPILAYKLEALSEEIDEVIFIVGYLGDQIKKYFGDLYAGKKISYVEQKKLNGSGGAIHLVKDFIKDDFLVMNGDDLYARKDIKNILKYDFAMLGLEISESDKFGVVSLDENGNLKEIIEKGKIAGSALANIGLYKLNKKFFDYPLVPIGNEEFGLPQTLVSVAKDFPVRVEKTTAWFPIGNPNDLEKAQEIIDKFI